MGGQGIVVKFADSAAYSVARVPFTQNSFTMDERDRQEGWVHAKLSGHRNEDLVTNLVRRDRRVQINLIKVANKTGNFYKISEGGLNENGIPSILGDSTKAKPDLFIVTDTGERVNVSLKKSSGGQVYLITVQRFIAGYEKQYNKAIPQSVKRAMSLFWGTAEDTEQIIDKFAVTEKSYQKRKHRLVRETLQRYNPKLPHILLEWFKENIAEVFDFCFIRGLAQDAHNWANVIWYKNLIPGETNEVKELMLNLDELRKKIRGYSNLVEYGTRTGGSTIQLPFGFVQWHQGQMQFHHKEDKIFHINDNPIKLYKPLQEKDMYYAATPELTYTF